MNIISSSSDCKYFSRLINLIGSIRKTNKNIEFEIWDIGLTNFQRWVLKVNNVRVMRVEKFFSHWDKCYSWKLYVYKHSESELFFHLDAGNIVLGDLKSVFEKIKTDGYFLVDQGQVLLDIVPKSYIDEFNPEVNPMESVFAAGNIGLNKNDVNVAQAIDDSYTAAINGYCLGFSSSEMFRDIHKIGIVRDCKLFRHDQSIINLMLRRKLNKLFIHSHEKFASLSADSNPVILNKRVYNYDYIKYYSNRYSYALKLYCIILDFYIRCVNRLKRIFSAS